MPLYGGWASRTGIAVTAAAGTVAAQLGLAYGLGVIDWVAGTGQAVDATGRALAALAWTVWIGASSTVIGALVAGRLDRARATATHRRTGTAAGRTGPAAGPVLVRRLAIAAAAAVGACAIVPLVAIPAQAAPGAGMHAGSSAGGYALAGVVAGFVVAVGALAWPAPSINLAATGVWVWLLAIASVVSPNAGQRAAGYAPLDVWRFTSSGWSVHGALYGWDILIMLGAALLIGAGAAWLPARRGANAIGTVLSGGSGPLLIAVAYFLAAPAVGVVQARTMAALFPVPHPAPPPELSAYLIAPYTVLIGLAASVLTTMAVNRWFRAASARVNSPALMTSTPTVDGDTVTPHQPGPGGVTGDRPGAGGAAQDKPGYGQPTGQV